MELARTIKYKALFLLVTFSLNSVVGFACSLDIGMGFNSDHHSHDRGKHDQHSDADTHHEHDGNNRHGHEHGTKSCQPSDRDHNTSAFFTSPNEDNCCKDFVVGFQSMDKMVTKGFSGVQQQHIVVSPFVIPFIFGLTNTKGFAEYFRIPSKEIDLPPPDILIFIQSFLI